MHFRLVGIISGHVTITLTRRMTLGMNLTEISVNANVCVYVQQLGIYELYLSVCVCVDKTSESKLARSFE